MAEAEQSYTTEVAGDVEDCVATLLDFERYPAWSSPITKAVVHERDADGRGRRVEFALDMKIRTVRYVLDYAYELPQRSTWRMAEGDVTAIEGSYEFEQLAPGRTRITCRQAIDLGFWVPGPLRRVFERQALRDSVEEFRAEAERRAEDRRGAARKGKR